MISIEIPIAEVATPGHRRDQLVSRFGAERGQVIARLVQGAEELGVSLSGRGKQQEEASLLALVADAVITAEA